MENILPTVNLIPEHIILYLCVHPAMADLIVFGFMLLSVVCFIGIVILYARVESDSHKRDETAFTREDAIVLSLLVSVFVFAFMAYAFAMSPVNFDKFTHLGKPQTYERVSSNHNSLYALKNNRVVKISEHDRFETVRKFTAKASSVKLYPRVLNKNATQAQRRAYNYLLKADDNDGVATVINTGFVESQSGKHLSASDHIDGVLVKYQSLKNN